MFSDADQPASEAHNIRYLFPRRARRGYSTSSVFSMILQRGKSQMFVFESLNRTSLDRFMVRMP